VALRLCLLVVVSALLTMTALPRLQKHSKFFFVVGG
jgi:hypothetical protein